MDKVDSQTHSGDKVVPGDIFAAESNETFVLIDAENVPSSPISAPTAAPAGAVTAVFVPVPAEHVSASVMGAAAFAAAEPQCGSINAGWKKEMPSTELPPIGQIEPDLIKD